MGDIDSTVQPDAGQVNTLHARLLTRLPWLEGHLSAARFGEAVGRSVRARFGDACPPPREVSSFVASLHAEDLAVATACADGDDVAWEHVITTHRPILYRAARALTGDEASARELADAIWAELYGVGASRASLEAGTPRRPLLEYFHGRSSLATWLRSVLAQRYVDQRRRDARHESFDADTADRGDAPRTADAATPSTVDPNPDRSRGAQLFREALDTALETLDTRDRLRLSYYYGQRLTLAETGRLLGEHEATTSRNLARSRSRIRANVEEILARKSGLTRSEITECYEDAVELGVVDLAQLLPASGTDDAPAPQETRSPPFTERRRHRV